MKKLDSCGFCKSKEFLDVLMRYGWCRFCMYDNLKMAKSRGISPETFEFALSALSKLPELPNIFSSKNIGENKQDLEIDYGILKQRLSKITYPSEIN